MSALIDLDRNEDQEVADVNDVLDSAIVPLVSTSLRPRKTRSDKGKKKTKPPVDARLIGIGGAPTRATTLPVEGTERKKYPVATGVLDYFPDAIVAVSRVSFEGNQQHNPGQPLNWARGKSNDEADTLIRHFLQRGTFDTDGQRHSAKIAWRALAILQKEIEAEQAAAQ